MHFLLSGEVFPLLLVLLASAMVSQFLGRRLRAPAIVLMLAVGMIVGLTMPGYFPELLKTLASVGLAYAFFLVGCEVEMTRVLRSSPVAWLFAGAGFASALLLGLIIGIWALGLGLVDSLLLGVVFSAASPFSRQLGPRFERMAGRQGFFLLGANDLGEVLRSSACLVLLAFRMPGQTVLSITSVIAVLAAAAACFWICSLLPSLWFGRTEDTANLGFAVLAGCGFASAALAGLVGLPPPVGALAAGLALGRYEPQGSVLDERLGFAAKNIFLPLAVVPVGIAVAQAPLIPGASMALPSTNSSFAAGLFACCLFVGPRLAAALSVLPLIPRGRWFRFFAMVAAPGAEASTLVYVFLAAALGLLGTQQTGFLVAVFAVSWVLEFLGGSESIEMKRRLPAVSTGSEARPRRDKREGSSAEILVALSNPATAQGLLWIGNHFRAQASFERIRALVVCESPESERELERAEYLVAQALVKARDAEGLIEPAIAM
ncbi:MAG: cation:proton antiporter, partial [Spirochaetota bacterium]